MKKIMIAIISSLTMFLVSCEDELDKFPLSALSPETFFTSASELEAFSNNFYNVFEDVCYDEQADNIIKDALLSEITGARTIPNSGGGWTWTELRNINTLIEYSVNCKDEEVRNEYVALARFFRAYFYYAKVQRFGDVPWYDKPLDSDDTESLCKPRDSRELVMQNILADLDNAIQYLTDSKNVYKVTKWTALALKSRVCLFEGTFRKYHGLDDYEKYLDASISASETFLNQSGYTIYTTGNPDVDYRDLFASVEAKSEEVILAEDYTNTYGKFHNGTYYCLFTSYGKAGLSRKFVDSYLKKDGTRYTDAADYKNKIFAEQVLDRDPRLAQTIRTPGYKRIDGNEVLPPNLMVNISGYHLHKFAMSVAANVDGYGLAYNDLPIFRTAEVYLNLAEAKAERGTLTQDDINRTIKPLRDRVGMPNLDMAEANANPDPYLSNSETGYVNVSGTNKGVILEIRRERSIELVMEGHRYYDIIRWKEGQCFLQGLYGIYVPGYGDHDLDGDGKADVYFGKSGEKLPDSSEASYIITFSDNPSDKCDIRLTNGTSGYIKPYTDGYQQWNEARDYYYPIPTDDRQLTNGALVQNPGWDDGLSF